MFNVFSHKWYQLPSEDLARSRINYVKQYFSNTLSDCRQCIFLDIEISLAASRKIKLKLLADEGNINASAFSNAGKPGTFFTVVQIGLNAVAILGGIVGDAAFSPAFYSLFAQYMSAELAEQLSFILSFSLVTGLFILFADLTPKRIGMIAPEAVALRIINPMRFCLLCSARWCGSSTAWQTSFSASLSCRWCVKTTSPLTTFMRWWKPARWPGCCVSRNTS
jgi:hypothetical protein